jgi:hypothetical protein
MDLREVGWEVVDCINLAQDRNQWWALLNMVMNELCFWTLSIIWYLKNEKKNKNKNYRQKIKPK